MTAFRRVAALAAMLAVLALSAAHAVMPAVASGLPAAAHEGAGPCPHDPAPAKSVPLSHVAGGPMCPLLGLPMLSEAVAVVGEGEAGWATPRDRAVVERTVFPREHPPRGRA